MDSQQLVFVLVLKHIFTTQLSVPANCEALAVSPTLRYGPMFSGKEVKEDVRRRRQHSRRKNNINFKPPPEDWPEPELGVGDFVASDQSDATSLSPLQAYQAKLEQELLKQQEEEAQGTENVNIDNPPKSPIWTSSEEDIKKLLDPNELLKHNKKLRPFVASHGKDAGDRGKDDAKSTVKQGSSGKSASIKSLTALKAAKTALKKSRRKTKITTDTPTRKGRKRKATKVGSTEDGPPPKQMKARKTQMKEAEEGETVKTKKRRKPVRKFAFATHQSQEGEDGITPAKSKSTRTRKPKLALPGEIESSTQTHATLTLKSTRGRPRIVSTTEKLTDWTTQLSVIDLFEKDSSTTQKTTTDFTNHTSGSSLTTTEKSSIHTTPTTLSQPTATSAMDKRTEVRERRKQMKQEMEEVIKAEKLEGSFGDKDTDWTTSEEQFYVEYNEMQNDMKRKIEALKKIRTTQKPENVTTFKNIYKNIIQLIN